MKPDDFTFLAQLVRRRSGLVLRPNRASFIESRLSTVLRRYGFRAVGALIHELRHGNDSLARAVSEAMTTNESSFFRDRPVFEKFGESVLPQLLKSRASEKRLRIWSAACAAGQEPYSIAMLLDDHKLLSKGWTIDLIATDFSPEMIARAQEGLYTHYEVQRGLAIRRLVAHFTQENGSWRIHENLRRMVSFRTFNLMDSFGWLDDLDVVFCRNVLLYFDQKTKASVLEKIADTLVSDGALVLGHAETPQGTFVPLDGAPQIYRHSKGVVRRLAVAS